MKNLYMKLFKIINNTNFTDFITQSAYVISNQRKWVNLMIHSYIRITFGFFLI